MKHQEWEGEVGVSLLLEESDSAGDLDWKNVLFGCLDQACKISHVPNVPEE